MTPAAAVALELNHSQMTIVSDLLGLLETDEEDIFQFPQGILGFTDCRRFILIRGGRDGLFWLQSVEVPALTFLLVDPFLFFGDYTVDLSPTDLRDIGGSAADEIMILAVTTLPRSREDHPTANLQGPIALNLRARTAKQIVLQNEEFGTRCSFNLDP